MSKLFAPSLRVRLLLLVLLAVTPAFGLAAYARYEQRELAKRPVQEKALQLAHTAAADQESMLQAAHAFLISIAQLPATSGQGPIPCNVLLGEIVQHNSVYANLGVIDQQGNVVCSAVPLPSQVNVSARPYFLRVLQTGQVAGDAFEIGNITNTPSINFAYPILNASGNPQSIVFGSLDLSWFRRFAIEQSLSPNMTLVVSDRQRALAVRYLGSDKPEVESLPSEQIVSAARDRYDETTMTLNNADGVERLYTFVSLATVGNNHDAFVGIGIPTSIAYAEADRVFARDLLLLAPGALLVLIAAWLFSAFFVARPVRRLAHATQQLSDGNLQMRIGEPYDPGEIGDLARMFDQMAETLQRRENERRQTEETLRRQAHEMEAITRVSRDLTLVPNLSQVLDSITRFAAEFSQADASGVFTFDADDQPMKISASHGVGELFIRFVNAKGIAIGPGAIGRAVATRQPVQIHDVLATPDYPFQAEMAVENIRAILAVPMLRGDTVTGGIVLWLRQPHEFTDQEIAFQQALAQQCVNAVENARLFEAEREQRKLAEALRDATAALNGTLEYEVVLDRILENVERVVPHDTSDIMLIQGKVARIVRFRDRIARENVPLNFEIEVDQAINFQQMIATGLPVIIPDTQTHPGWIHFPETEWIRSNIGAPICVRGQVIGFLILDSHLPNFFNTSHILPLQAFANQAAIALDNTRLLSEAKQQAKQFAALYETTRDTASHQEMSALLSMVVTRARMLLNAAVGHIYLFDATRDELELTVADGKDAPMGTRLKLGEGLAGRVAQSRQTMIAEDYRMWPGHSPVFADLEISAVIQVPMVYDGELVGVLGVHELGDTHRKYTDADARLLALFANQAASAVHNARLYQETRERAEQLALLYDAGLALNSLLEPRAQLIFLFSIAARALDADRVSFFQVDAKQNRIRLEICVGYSPETEVTLRNLECSVDDVQTIIGWVANHRLPCNVPDVSADPRYVVVDPMVRSGLWVPIEHENQIQGVLGIVSTQLNAFTPQDERLITLFANQAAVAMENARLFSETQQRIERLALLNRIAKVVNQTMRVDELLALINHEVTAAVPSEASFIALYDPATNELDYRVQVDGAKHLPPARRPLRTSFSQIVIATQKPLLIRDWEKEKDQLPKPNVWGSMQPARSWLGVPINAGERVIGILNVQSYRPQAYDTEEEQLLVTIADQVAVAIQNARLFEETNQRLLEMEAVNKCSIALRTAQSPDEILPLLLDETLAALGTANGYIMVKGLTPEASHTVVRGWFADLDDKFAVLRETIASRVIETTEPYVTPEFATAQPNPTLPKSIPTGWGGAGVPIRTAQQVIGVLCISVQRPREIQPHEVRLLTTLAEVAGNAFQRASLHAQTEQHLRRLNALHTIDTTINASLDLRVTLSVLLDQVSYQLSIDAADILLLNPHTQTFEYAAGQGFHSNALSRITLPIDKGFPNRVVIERRILRVPVLAANPNDQRAELLVQEGFVTYYAVPLFAKGQLRGVLEIFQRKFLDPDSEWLGFLETLAGQAAIAIDNATLFESLQRSNLDLSLAYDATIEGWSHALDLRDEETEGHTQRVTELTLQLAQRIGLSDAEMASIRRGALLHDIGKMGIPDAILLKPSALTNAEWEIMCKHPKYAYDLLNPIEYLRSSINIPYCHHEKWDGTGYPRGLSGEEIPLEARIFAVADVWDALCSKRPYRRAWPKERVMEHIQSLTGSHFDPKIVAAFLQMVDRNQVH